MRKILLIVLLSEINFMVLGQENEIIKISQNCSIKITVNETSDDNHHVQVLKLNKKEIEEILPITEEKYYEHPSFFKFDGNTFIRIHEIYFGTGYSNFDYIYQISNSCKFSEVETDIASIREATSLPDSIHILKGEHRTFADNEITFYFGLWVEGDPNCCPSIGINGTYEIKKVRIQNKWKFVMRPKGRRLDTEFSD